MPERTPVEMVEYLSGQLALEHAKLQRLSRYYEGEQPLKYMAPALQDELGDRITQLVINWPRMGVDAYENRLDIEGFRFPGQAEGDDRLWGIWQANDLDEVSQQAHLESLILGRSYAIVGPNPEEQEIPIITVEHPSQVITHHDPRTRKVIAGLKRWTDDDDKLHATLYLPTVNHFFIYEGGKWVDEQDPNRHNRGFCSLVPLVNRPRMLKQRGTSELADVIPIADAANKMATDMMISGEFHAMPRRAWFGLSEDDFTDDDGNPIPVWDRIAGREWATERTKDEATVVQFSEADLSNFHNTIKMLAQVASQMLALPPHYMQFAGANPASADAIRSSEAQLVKRAERKQRILGGSWEQVMRIACRIAGIDTNGDLRRLETVWRDASTPTRAQKADAAVKLYQVGISTLRQSRKDVGYSETEIELMEQQDAQALERDPLNAFARQQEAVSAAGRAELQEQD